MLGFTSPLIDIIQWLLNVQIVLWMSHSKEIPLQQGRWQNFINIFLSEDYSKFRSAVDQHFYIAKQLQCDIISAQDATHITINKTLVSLQFHAQIFVVL